MKKTLLSLALLLPAMGAMAEQVTVETFVTRYLSFSSDGSNYTYSLVAYQDIQTMYGAGGEKFAETTYKLTPAKDAAGNYAYAEDGTPLYSRKTVSSANTYSYDAEGRLSKYKDGYYDIENVYDEKGRLYTSSTYSFGSLYYKKTYTYDDATDLLLEVVQTGASGSVSSSVAYDYDDNGNMIEKAEYQKGGTNNELYNFRSTLYTYDENNVLQKDTLICHNYSGSETTSYSGGYTYYFYNMQGLLSERQEYRNDIMSSVVKLDHAYLFTYNEEGSLICMKSCPGITPTSALSGSTGGDPYFRYDIPEYIYDYTVATLDPEKMVTDFTAVNGVAPATVDVTIGNILVGVEGYRVAVDGVLLDSTYTGSSFTVEGVGNGTHEVRIAPIFNGAFLAFSSAKSVDVIVNLPAPSNFVITGYEWKSYVWEILTSWTAPAAEELPAGAKLTGYKIVYKDSVGTINNFASPMATAVTAKGQSIYGTGVYSLGIYAVYNYGTSDTIFTETVDLTDKNSLLVNNPYDYKKVDSKGNETTYLYRVNGSSFQKASEITADSRIDYTYLDGQYDTTRIWALSYDADLAFATQKLVQMNVCVFDDDSYLYTDTYYSIADDGTKTSIGYKQYGELQYVGGNYAFENTVYDVDSNAVSIERGYTATYYSADAYEISVYTVVDGVETLSSKTVKVMSGTLATSDTTYYYDAAGNVTETVSGTYSVSNVYHKTRVPQNLTASYNADFAELTFSWEAPANTLGLTGYEIYENGHRSDHTLSASRTSYTIYSPAEGVNTVAVVPCYNGLPSCAAVADYEVKIPVYAANSLKALKDSTDLTTNYFLNVKLVAPIVVTNSSDEQGTAFAQDATTGAVLVFEDGLDAVPAAGTVLTNVCGGMACYGMTETHLTHVFNITSFDVVATDSVVAPLEVAALTDLDFAAMEGMLVTVKDVTFEDGMFYSDGATLHQGDASVFAFGYFTEEDMTFDKTYNVTANVSYVMGWSCSDALEIHSADDITLATGLSALKQAGMALKGGVISAEGAKSITIFNAAGAELARGAEAVKMPAGVNVVIVKAEMANGETVVAKYMR